MDRYREELQRLISTHLDDAPRGTAGPLAREAGISPATLSKLKSGIYTGDLERVGARLAETIASRDAAAAIASGKYRLAWLVRTRSSLRIVRRAETVETITKRNTDAHVIQVWLGPEPQDVHFVKTTPP